MSEPCVNLANAVVTLAAEDYRKALRELKKDPFDKDALIETKTLERFFRDSLFMQFTTVDPEAIISGIKREVERC